MLPIMRQIMMSHGNEQRGGKMKMFIVLLFTIFMVLAMQTAHWLGYVLTIVGFLVMLKFTDELENET